MLKLAFSINFSDLYTSDGLKKLDEIFLSWLDKQENSKLIFANLLNARQNKQNLNSEHLIELSILLEDFIGTLFDINSEIKRQQEQVKNLKNILHCRKIFIQKRVTKKQDIDEKELNNSINILRNKGVLKNKNDAHVHAKDFADFVLNWLENDDEISLTAAAYYANYLIYSSNKQIKNSWNEENKVLFSIPNKLDYDNLIPDLIYENTNNSISNKYYDEFQNKDFTEQENSQSNLYQNNDFLDYEPRKLSLPNNTIYGRADFNFYDSDKSVIAAQKNAFYCIYCHNRQKDSCSHGFIQNNTHSDNRLVNNSTEMLISHLEVSINTSKVLTNPLGIELHGCPLKEKISEMNLLKAQGYIIAPLIVATIDNPMIAATGHRICNDCMKSCIYQKQEPVNIPLIETQTLDQVLELTWGFEIYSLLTRWNPCKIDQPYPIASDSNHRVLVVGLGPAGFTLAHYLLNNGITVVNIDGSKIEPLPSYLIKDNFKPIKKVQELFVNLKDRIPKGFGGVMEYGITVRWQKNYLILIRLLLERRENFRFFDGIRFGSQIGFDNLHALGFDHIALALGAGKPNIPKIDNILAKGVRTASDFLMSLQLSGAGNKQSLANMQIRMPIIIIGSGLTAIDSATESLVYYCVQIEKLLRQYEKLGNALFENLNSEEIEIAYEFLSHAKQLRNINEGDEKSNGKDLGNLLRSWGGATILYRKSINDSPAYRINHEEMIKAFEQGIYFIEHATPIAVETNQWNQCIGMYYNIELNAELYDKFSTKLERESAVEYNTESKLPKYNKDTKYISAKTVLIAAGTEPNTVIIRENDHNSLDLSKIIKFQKNNKYFDFIPGKNFLLHSGMLSRDETAISQSNNDFPFGISCFGDLHFKYSGNVVKAMASAKYGYSEIIEDLELAKSDFNSSTLLFEKDKLAFIAKEKLETEKTLFKKQTQQEFFANLEDKLIARIEQINVLASKVIEIVVKAPLAAQRFKPGQFFRLQNYKNINNKIPLIESIALTGASCDNDRVSLILLEVGSSTNICRHLSIGEKVVLMGPTGSPTEIPKNENILLIGGGLGNAVLFSIGKAMKQNHCKVLYFAGYRSEDQICKKKEIEDAADKVVWCCEDTILSSTRKEDIALQGNIIQCLETYSNVSEKETLKIKEKSTMNTTSIAFNSNDFSLKKIDRILVIGSSGLMEAVTKWRYYGLGKKLLSKNCKVIASINSPMQCMMKEICGQCLQRQVNDKGEESYVYSCFQQDQNAKYVDFCFLQSRLQQNSLQEKISSKIQEML